MAAKWMDFGGPADGKGVNTVVVAGNVLRKNQLGNITFMFIADLYPVVSNGTDASLGYGQGQVGQGARYSGPYSSNYGNYADKPRADNLAAFGIGHGLSRELEIIAGWNKDQTPTLAQVKAFTVAQMTKAIENVFKDASVARRVNTYHRKYPTWWSSVTIMPGALYFVPEWKGFNTQSLKSSVRPPTKPIKTSIEAFNDIKKASGLGEGAELDIWLKKELENYMLPAGR
jgi:hypothetical protein